MYPFDVKEKKSYNRKNRFRCELLAEKFSEKIIFFLKKCGKTKKSILYS